MNNRALTLSLFMAAMAVFFVYNYVSSIEEEQTKKFGTQVLVVTAKKDIREMDALNEASIELKSVPKNFIGPATIYFEKKEEDKEVTKEMKNLIGTIALVPIRKGEQLTYNKLTEPGIRTGLAPQISPGKRAVAVPVNDSSSVAKLLKPGDRVDVIAIVDLGAGKDQLLVKTILQDVIVLATGRNITNNPARMIEMDPFTGKDRVRSLADDSTFTSVTLEVDPNQAQTLALISKSAENSLILSLRNNDDTDRPNVASTTYVDVLGSDIGRIQRGPARR